MIKVTKKDRIAAKNLREQEVRNHIAEIEAEKKLLVLERRRRRAMLKTEEVSTNKKEKKKQLFEGDESAFTVLRRTKLRKLRNKQARISRKAEQSPKKDRRTRSLNKLKKRDKIVARNVLFAEEVERNKIMRMMSPQPKKTVVRKKAKKVVFEPFDFEETAATGCLQYLDALSMDYQIVDKHITLYGAIAEPKSTMLDNLHVIENCSSFDEARYAFIDFFDAEIMRSGVKLGKQLRGSYAFEEIMDEAGKLKTAGAPLNKPMNNVLKELARGALIFQNRLGHGKRPLFEEQKSWYDGQNAVRSILFLKRYSFDKKIQDRIIDDIIAGENTHYIYSILPYMKLNNKHVVLFMKEASRDMIVAYLTKGKVINRKAVNILRMRLKPLNLYWCIRGTGTRISMFDDVRRTVRLSDDRPFDKYKKKVV